MDQILGDTMKNALMISMVGGGMGVGLKVMDRVR